MSTLVVLLALLHSDILSINFGTSSESPEWVVINDGVMGGLSSGEMSIQDNSIKFSGTVSLANRGGFASVRSRQLLLNLTEAEEVEIRYKLSGMNFAIVMNQYSRFYFPNYKYPILETNNEWATITIPINEFKENQVGNYTGRSFENANKKRPFIQIGFISDEKKAHAFELEVDYLIIR